MVAAKNGGIVVGGERKNVQSCNHANYYGAYVRDPEGNKIQAVCHSKNG